jgi:hypothetical protein
MIDLLVVSLANLATNVFIGKLLTVLLIVNIHRPFEKGGFI